MRVVIVEDHPEVREALESLLKRAEDALTVAGSYATAEEALASLGDLGLAGEARPLALVDLGLPGMSGAAFIRKARARFSNLGFVILSGAGDETSIVDAVLAGANGYARKPFDAARLMAALRAVGDGGMAFESSVQRVIAEQMRKRAARAELQLTSRERQVLEGYAVGKKPKDIADDRNLATESINAVTKSLFRKLGVHSREEALAKARESGWL